MILNMYIVFIYMYINICSHTYIHTRIQGARKIIHSNSGSDSGSKRKEKDINIDPEIDCFRKLC